MKSNRFFLDTAYVLALLNQKDTYHKQAKKMLPSMHSAREVWLTEAVLIEIANALASSHRSAAIAFINSCYFTPNVRVVSVDSKLLRRAMDFYEKRGDKEWGLTDCISFIVMDENDLKEAFTTDDHFQQAGFRALLLEWRQSFRYGVPAAGIAPNPAHTSTPRAAISSRTPARFAVKPHDSCR